MDFGNFVTASRPRDSRHRGCRGGGGAPVQRARQPSNAEAAGVRRRGVLRVLVADGRRVARPVLRRLVQTAAGRRVRRRLAGQRQQRAVSSGGVGTAGATGALAPAMLKPRGREFLFAAAILSRICARCSLNFHSLSLCCLHTINKQKNAGLSYP